MTAASVMIACDLPAADLGSYTTLDTSRNTPTPGTISAYVDQHNSSQLASDFDKPSPLPSISKPLNGFDSGYASFAPTPEKGNLAQKLLKRTPKKLSIFERDVTDAVKNRFHDLCVLFNEPLYRYLGKHGVILTAISIKLKYAGESEATAKPWIIVQCDERASKRVRRFFNQQQLKAQYQPRDAQPPDVDFGLLVQGTPPKEMATNSEHYIYGNKWDGAATLCGKPIKICTSNETRLATLGGLIKVVSSGRMQLYGMTAGHVVTRGNPAQKILDDDDGHGYGNQCTEVESATVDNNSVAGATGDEPTDEALATVEHSSDRDKDSKDHDGSSEEGEDEEEYELDFGSMHRQQGISNIDPVALSQGLRRNDLLRFHWPELGHLSFVSDQSVSNNDLDWALIQFQDLEIFRPNLLIFPEHTNEFGVIANLREGPRRLTRATRSREVLILSGMAGLKRGKLATSFGYLMIGPVKRFNETYNVSMSEGSVLDAGDCGSWVVDSVTHEVYGHVVASDSFGDAYVIPLDNTFSDMKQQLAADEVCLPTHKEVLDWSQRRSMPRFPWHPSIFGTPATHSLGLSGSEYGIRSERTTSDSGYSSMRSTPRVSPKDSIDGSSGIMSTASAKGVNSPKHSISSGSVDLAFYEQDAPIAHVGEQPVEVVSSKKELGRLPRKRRASAADTGALRKRTSSSLALLEPAIEWSDSTTPTKPRFNQRPPPEAESQVAEKADAITFSSNPPVTQSLFSE